MDSCRSGACGLDLRSFNRICLAVSHSVSVGEAGSAIVVVIGNWIVCLSGSGSVMEIGAPVDVLVDSWIGIFRVENCSHVDWDDRNNENCDFHTCVELNCTELKKMLCVIDADFHPLRRLVLMLPLCSETH